MQLTGIVSVKADIKKGVYYEKAKKCIAGFAVCRIAGNNATGGPGNREGWNG